MKIIAYNDNYDMQSYSEDFATKSTYAYKKIFQKYKKNVFEYVLNECNQNRVLLFLNISL